MSKHTPTPWRVHPDFPLCIGRYHNLALQTCRYGDDRETGSICHFDGNGIIKGEYPGRISFEEAKANAQRICSCVNALQDIPDPARTIPALVEKAKAALTCLDGFIAMAGPCDHAANICLCLEQITADDLRTALKELDRC